MPNKEEEMVSPSASSVANAFRRGASIVPVISRKKSSKLFDMGDSKYASMIDQKSHEIMDSQFMETIRLKVKKYMATSWVGKLYDNILLVLSVISCILYIAQTYFNGAHYDKGVSQRDIILQYFALIELGLAALFAFDWSLNLFIADHRTEQFLSFFAMIDLATVIPIWITYFFIKNPVQYDDIITPFDAFNYALRGAHTLRILRALRVHKNLVRIENEVNRFVGELGVSVLTMILFDSAVLAYLEHHKQQIPFHTWMYGAVVTITTVGYGDIAPATTLGQFAMMAFISFAIIYVPKQSNELVEVMGRSSKWAREKYVPRPKTKHVIICGDLKSTALREFFSELFHEDHENMNLNAVILQPVIPNTALGYAHAEPPSKEIHEIISDPIFSIVTHYLEGSTLNDIDLNRASAHSAIAIFLMGNKFCVDPDDEDAKTILQHYSIKRFLSSRDSCDPLFCLQMIRPENRRHLAVNESDEDKEVVVCLNEMKMGVIAKSCMFPGTGTLLFNLLTSFADNDEGGDDSADEDTEGGFDSDRDGSDDDDDDIGWIQEYQKGCDWEIYTTELADVFEGAKFGPLAHQLYNKMGILLFALRVRELKGKGAVHVLLNPAEYRLPSNDKYYVEGFVIAKNKAASDLSFTSLSGSSSFHNIVGNVLAKTQEVGSSATRRQSLVVGHRGIPQIPHGKVAKAVGWQEILGRYEHAEVSHNQQEAKQNMEDEHLRRNFFIRESPQEYQEALVETALLEEFPNMFGHTIVIAKTVSNLFDFIQPLRARYLGLLKHIVVLFPHDIPQNVWRRISIFEGVLVVKGSPLEEGDIRRAGIFRASKVVLLAEPNSMDVQSGLSALADADAIFTYHTVRRLNEKAQIVIEIVQPTNVGYLDPAHTVNTHHSDFKFTPQFANGMLFTSSVLDAIVCQAFYNPQIIRVLGKLISGAEVAKNSLKGSRKSNKSGVSAIQSSSLYQIPIPDNLETRTYGSLFNNLISTGIIPLGLFRGVFANMSVGAKGNKLSYVYTNPPKDTELFTCDRVFVLSPQVISATKMTPKEVIDDFTLISQRSPRASKESAINCAMDNYKVSARTIAQTETELNMTFNSLTTDLNKKVDDALSELAAMQLSRLSIGSPSAHLLKSPSTSRALPVLRKQSS